MFKILVFFLALPPHNNDAHWPSTYQLKPACSLQAIGCLGMRACHTNNCPVGIATQKEHLRARLDVEQSARQLFNFFHATNELIKVVARACGHDDVTKFGFNNWSTFDFDMHRLTGIPWAAAAGKAIA